MHPNNKRKIQANINLKKKRNPINVPMDLSALPSPAECKKIMPEMTFVGFYMMVWCAKKEIEAADYIPDGLADRHKQFLDWLTGCENYLPVWFATRYL